MKKYCLGIDIGGTSVKFGLFDREGRLLEKWSIPTNTDQKGNYILQETASSVKEKLDELGIREEELFGIGAGVPGQVNEAGEVLLAENLGWVNEPVKKNLEVLTGLAVQVENDANLAALGEIWEGSAANCHSMIFVTLGTGIGCGIVVKNKIISGVNGAAGEIGHIHVEDDMPKKCNCGSYGCLEQLASATGIGWMAGQALKASEEPSLLREGEVTARTVFEAVRKGDNLAVRVAERFGLYLGKTLAMCTCVLNPEMVVIGGGVSKAGEIVLEYIQKYYRRYAYQPCKDTKFCLASLGSDAGIYGAAKLIMDAV